MSFLDNLENNLKALESRDATGLDDSKRRDREKAQAVASGPWAEQLKKGPYAAQLIQTATRAGFQIRTKVNLAWMGSTLRLEARGHKLELRPTATGVVAVFVHGREELKAENIDLNASPAPLVAGWMKLLEEQKKIDETSVPAADPDDVA